MSLLRNVSFVIIIYYGISHLCAVNSFQLAALLPTTTSTTTRIQGFGRHRYHHHHGHPTASRQAPSLQRYLLPVVREEAFGISSKLLGMSHDDNIISNLSSSRHSLDGYGWNKERAAPASVTATATVTTGDQQEPAISRRQFNLKSIFTAASSSSVFAAAAAWTRPQSAHATTTATLSSPPSSLSMTQQQQQGNSVPAIPKSLCDPSVSTFRNPSNNRIVHILGTAHISSASAQVAGQLVRDIRPSAVFVELDAKRVGRAIPKPSSGGGSSSNDETSTLQQQQEDKEVSREKGVVIVSSPTTTENSISSSSSSTTTTMTEENLIKPKNPFNIREKLLNKASQVVGNTIKGLYQKLESEGFSAGEEFIVAVREGLNSGSQIVLGDQDVEVTLRRLTEALSKTDMKKLLAADAEMEQNMKQLMPDISQSVNGGSSGGSSTGEMSKEQFTYFVETIKAKENVRMLMANLKAAAPEVYQAMVGERDVYMANGLDRLNQFESIVAVMGVAHVEGVERTLKERGWEEIQYPLCSMN